MRFLLLIHVFIDCDAVKVSTGSVSRKCLDQPLSSIDAGKEDAFAGLTLEVDVELTWYLELERLQMLVD